jgi:hypothetical protein
MQRCCDYEASLSFLFVYFIANKKQTVITALDFNDAFGQFLINYYKLIKENLKLPKRLINLNIGIYKGIEGRIFKNSKASRPIKLNISVKQGCISVLYYLIFA